MIEIMKRIVEDDASWVLKDKNLYWDIFRNKKILITGVSGLYGRTITKVFDLLNKQFKFNIELYLLTSSNKNYSFLDLSKFSFHKFLTWNELDDLPSLDYIYHCASPTDSNFFLEHPVETIESIVSMNQSLLTLAKSRDADYILLSTMEVYGTGGLSVFS